MATGVRGGGGHFAVLACYSTTCWCDCWTRINKSDQRKSFISTKQMSRLFAPHVVQNVQRLSHRKVPYPTPTHLSLPCFASRRKRMTIRSLQRPAHDFSLLQTKHRQRATKRSCQLERSRYLMRYYRFSHLHFYGVCLSKLRSTLCSCTKAWFDRVLTWRLLSKVTLRSHIVITTLQC